MVMVFGIVGIQRDAPAQMRVADGRERCDPARVLEQAPVAEHMNGFLLQNGFALGQDFEQTVAIKRWFSAADSQIFLARVHQVNQP
ncbi:hypothetical protein D9M71_682320 [compost metagenome]